MLAALLAGIQYVAAHSDFCCRCLDINGGARPKLVAHRLSRATLIVLELTLITAPFIALMSVANHFANSSKMSMIYAILTYLTLATLVAFALEYSAYAEYLFYLFPGFQGTETIAQNINLTRFATPVLHSLVLIAISCELLRRRAL